MFWNIEAANRFEFLQHSQEDLILLQLLDSSCVPSSMTSCIVLLAEGPDTSAPQAVRAAYPAAALVQHRAAVHVHRSRF